MRYNSLKLFSIGWLAILITGASMLACNPTEEAKPNLRRPIINSFIPIAASVGDTVTIIGRNFSEVISENVVTINQTPAEIKFASRVRLVIVIPQGATSGKLELSVKGTPILDPEDFFIYDVPSPIISNIVPLVGRAGEIVTIEGDNFSDALENNKVTLSEVSCKVIEATKTSLKIVLPDSTRAGRITVFSNGRSTNSQQIFDYRLPPPEITGLKSVEGILGTSIPTLALLSRALQEGEYLYIEGKNFSPISGENEIYFESDLPGPILSTFPVFDSTALLIVRIPFGTKSITSLTVKVLGQETKYMDANGAAKTISVKQKGTWKARFPAPTTGNVYYWTIGESIYVMSRSGRDFWKYTPGSSPNDPGTWEQKASFGITAVGVTSPDPNAVVRPGAATFVGDGKAYLIGGRNETLIDVWVYEPEANRWVRKQNFAPVGFPGITLPGSGQFIPLLFRNAVAWTLDGKAYVGFNKGTVGVAGWVNIPCGCPFENASVAQSNRVWQFDYRNEINFNRSIATNEGNSIAWKEIGSPNNPGFQNTENSITTAGENINNVTVVNNTVYAYQNLGAGAVPIVPGIYEVNIMDGTVPTLTVNSFKSFGPGEILNNPEIGTALLSYNNQLLILFRSGSQRVPQGAPRITLGSFPLEIIKIDYSKSAPLNFSDKGLESWEGLYAGGEATFNNGIFTVLPSGRIFAGGGSSSSAGITNFFEYIPNP